jgi:Tol biopolymer transport system component
MRAHSLHRQLTDGSVLVVAARSSDAAHPGFSLWRVASDNTVTFLATLPEMTAAYGGADVSHSGTRVAYLASPSYTPELRILDVASGVVTLLEVNARSPRWSSQDDRLAYLVPGSSSYGYDGTLVVSNRDGTGRRALGNTSLSPGLTWSPDGNYVVGRSSDYSGLRLVRVSDAMEVVLPFSSPTVCCHDYWQPDWR